MHHDFILDIERPHPRLLFYYMLRAILTGPAMLFTIPYLYFRYSTLHYTFDHEGIHMRWGILFRREINLTYARIQDIHLTSGLLQRWFGLADIQVQTASGSNAAEMTIEGLLEFQAIRDFLYNQMRGYRDASRAGAAPTMPPMRADSNPADDSQALLREAVAELRAARRALEALAPQQGGANADV